MILDDERRLITLLVRKVQPLTVKLLITTLDESDIVRRPLLVLAVMIPVI